MGRPHRIRHVERTPDFTYFQPRSDSFKKGYEVVLSIAEFEAMRLRHHQNKKQEECARLMNVSQPTFSRILENAHKKITEALIYGKAIRIEGGPVGIKKVFVGYGCTECLNEWEDESASEKIKISLACPKCSSKNIYFLKKDIVIKET